MRLSFSRHRLRWFLLAPVLILVAGIGSLVGASHLEERDSFCTSCHLAPETSYHERAQAALPVTDPFLLPDLASFHYWKQSDFRCIDCHRGDDSLGQRLRVLALAGGDTLTYLFGNPDQSLEKGAVAAVDPNQDAWQGPHQFNRAPDVLNAGCLKCHQDTLTLVGFDNHFHNKLPASHLAYAESGTLFYPDNWDGGAGGIELLPVEESVLTCLDCHRAHVEGFESEFFLDAPSVVLPACVQCHLETGKGPPDLNR